MSISVKLVSHQCGVFSRRVLLDASSPFSDLLSALKLAPDTQLLYRETPHRCSELVLLAADSDWEAAKCRAAKQGGEVVVLSQQEYKERKAWRKRVLGVVALAIVAPVVLTWAASLCIRSSGIVAGIFFAVMGLFFGLGLRAKCAIGAVTGGKCTRNINNNNRCNRNATAAPEVPEVPAAAAPESVPVVQYKEQLQTLFSLGFNDVRHNVELLQRCAGDINLVVHTLLNDKQ